MCYLTVLHNCYCYGQSDYWTAKGKMVELAGPVGLIGISDATALRSKGFLYWLHKAMYCVRSQQSVQKQWLWVA